MLSFALVHRIKHGYCQTRFQQGLKKLIIKQTCIWLNWLTARKCVLAWHPSYAVDSCNIHCTIFLTMVKPGCIPCKPHAGDAPAVPQVYANVVRLAYSWGAKIKRTVRRDLHFIMPVRQRVEFRLYLRHHADRKANSTPEIFGPKCMECILVVKLFAASMSQNVIWYIVWQIFQIWP